MTNQDLSILLKRHFNNHPNIDKARKELAFIFQIKRDDEPVCPICDSNDLNTLGNYTNQEHLTGTEYKCSKCKLEFDFDNIV